MKNKEIKLADGVGDLNFAMTEKDIIKVLGHPNGIDKDTLNDCIVYYYDELGLAVVFKEIDNKLNIESFEMEHEAYILWETEIFNKPFDKIIELFNEKQISEFEITHNDDSSHILYHNLYIGWDFGLDKVSDICLSNPNI